MKFVFGTPFEKEFKKLCKKYQSLQDDFAVFCLTLEQDPRGKNLPEGHIERIGGLGENQAEYEFYKVRRFICRSISRNSGNSGLRIIYTYRGKSEIVFEELEFIEVYHKNEKENHDIERLKKFLKDENTIIKES